MNFLLQILKPLLRAIFVLAVAVVSFYVGQELTAARFRESLRMLSYRSQMIQQRTPAGFQEQPTFDVTFVDGLQRRWANWPGATFFTDGSRIPDVVYFIDRNGNLYRHDGELKRITPTVVFQR